MPGIGGSLKFGNWEIELRGLNELKRKLTTEGLYAEPFRDGMEQIGRVGEDFAIVGAPLGHEPGAGQTISRMFHTVSQARPIPLSVKIGTHARRRGYPYPVLLEYSPKHHHQFWLERAILRAWPHIQAKLGGVAQAIERRWAA